MTLAELVAAFRARASDTARPYLWPDDEVHLYLNQAEREAAERARLIYDETVELPLMAGEARYDLPDSTLEVVRAWLPGGRLVTILSREEVDARRAPGDSAAGTPRLAFETGDGALMLWPVPATDGMLHLAVFRLPAGAMQADDDTPEIHPRHHFRMLDWALRCAYLKDDADAFNEQKAQFHESQFERSFGFRPDASVQRKQRDKRVPLVWPNW